MRTLKFRRYNAYLKEMDEPIDWLPGERTDTDFWMQFTGLLDCHEKEIYEGDVLKEIGIFDDDGKQQTMEVKFENGAFGDGYESFNEINGEYEVIGNIHENPNLL